MNIYQPSTRFEVRPKAQQNGTLVAVGCGLFTLAGLWMISEGEILGGFLAVIFFGGIGLIAIPRLFRRRISMVLTPQGIEQVTIYGAAQILWRDIEQIGICSQYGTKMVGIRLRCYDNYLAHISPELAGSITKSLPYLKLLSTAASLLDLPASMQLWSRLEGRDPQEALKSFGKVGSLAEVLYWQRNAFGYDIAFSWADLDRSPEKFVNFLVRYWGQFK